MELLDMTDEEFRSIVIDALHTHALASVDPMTAAKSFALASHLKSDKGLINIQGLLTEEVLDRFAERLEKLVIQDYIREILEEQEGESDG